ncbi:protein lysA [Escherichia coli]|nr:protein lysA [Escherichia coli]
MKKLSLSLMLALSLIYPQSVAVSFVAAWSILATVICVVAGGVGVYATEYVLERYGRELPPESLAVKIVTSLFLQPVPWRRRAAALVVMVVMVVTFISLVAAGWIFTALIYLVTSVFFRLIRTACRQRFEGREPCQS